MDLHRKSEIELKYFLERRLVTVANQNSSSTKDLRHGFDDLPRPKNKYQQKQSSAQQNKSSSSQNPGMKKASSCNELVMQFERQFQPSAMFQGRKAMASEVFVDPSAGRQPRRPLMANRDIFERQLDNNLHRKPPDAVQRIVNQHSQNPRNTEKLDGSKQDLDKSSNQHKVVIYFGDSIGNNRRNSCSVGDLVHASRPTEDPPIHPKPRRNEPNDVIKQLKSVLEEKKTPKESKVVLKPAPAPPPMPPAPGACNATNCQVQVNQKPVAKEKPPRKDKLAKQQQMLLGESAKVNSNKIVVSATNNKDQLNKSAKPQSEQEKRSVDLPDFVESVSNDGVINIKIDGSYNVAKELVESVAMGTSSVCKASNDVGDVEIQNHEPQSFDWSFVQEWRSR